MPASVHEYHQKVAACRVSAGRGMDGARSALAKYQLQGACVDLLAFAYAADLHL
jgi:hypothetical protein